MPRFEPHPKRRPAIVAGASSGIGAATAVELAAHGFPVALGARRVEKCQEIVEKVRANGGEAIALPLDVTDPDRSRDLCTRPPSSSVTSRFSSPAQAIHISEDCTKSTPRLSNRRSRSI